MSLPFFYCTTPITALLPHPHTARLVSRFPFLLHHSHNGSLAAPTHSTTGLTFPFFYCTTCIAALLQYPRTAELVSRYPFVIAYTFAFSRRGL
jgi:hypothetical protein